MAMGKKGKKRQLNESEAVVDKPIEKKTEVVRNKDVPNKKAKINAKEPAVVKAEEVKVNDNVDGNKADEKKPKNKKKNKGKKQGNAENNVSDQSVSLENSAEKTEEVAEEAEEANTQKKKRKEKLKLKREQSKEIRKEIRKEEGNFSSINKLSVEEMKQKIAEIETREAMSKTAVRKLRILKKKLSIEEGTIDITSAPKRANDDTNSPNNKKFKKDVQMKNEITSPTKVESVKMNEEKNDLPVKKEGKLNVSNNKSKKDQLKFNKAAKQPVVTEDKSGSKKLKKNNKKANKNNTEESEISVEKRILEEVLNAQKVNGKKVAVQNGKDEEDSENEEELQEEAVKLNSNDDSENDDDDDDVDGDDDDGDDDDGDDNDDDDDNEEEDVEEDNDNDDGAEEKEVSDSVKVENNKSQATAKPEKKDIKKPNQTQNNQNAGAGKKQRYVLFVGNLSYDATTVDIKKHFLTKVDIVKDVRIPSKHGTNTPRGFAYVELENSVDYEKGLSLHDTFINGRKINVEYTSSGSKRIGNKQELVHKNKKLHAMRKAGMLAGSKKTFQKRSFRRKPDRNPKNEN